eukprot:5481410-Amphidinium_carterae.1
MRRPTFFDPWHVGDPKVLDKKAPRCLHPVTLVEALPGLLTMFQKEVGEYVQELSPKNVLDPPINPTTPFEPIELFGA